MHSAGTVPAPLDRKPAPAEQQAAAAHLQGAEKEAAQSRRIPDGVMGAGVESAGIVGFGTMGRGIALSFAAAGIPVAVFEESDEAWLRGEAGVAGSLARAVGRGRIDEAEAERRLRSIRRAGGFEDLGGVDFLVEAVFEELRVKTGVFARLDAVARPGAVLATNTSSLDVNAIAAATGRPQAVVGTHFFSPAHVMRLLEVVVGEATSAATLATAISLGLRLGKTPVPVGVCDGFVGNRMLYAYRRQADRLLLEGALPEQIDGALQRFGFRMGPFAVADLAGLDIGRAVRQRLASEAAARGAPPPPPNVADRLSERGRLGQKTGAGFYRYEPGNRTPLPDPEVAAIARRESAAQGIERRQVGDHEILERCLFALVNEGAEILGEGIAEREGDVDVVWALGYGFPRERGGPLYWARQVGLPEVVGALDRLAEATGDPRLEPSRGLLELAVR
jgi:3-hydroxyacyl-CoA dehydrogenase